MSNIAALCYLAASVLFILALKGLSSPKSARRGNIYGMTGMALAILTTLSLPAIASYSWIILGIAIGGGIGYVIANRIKMTQMPQLVAAFHSLVGLAAVCIAFTARWSPEQYHIGTEGALPALNLFEMGLGAIIGAITFSGSLIAFAKLHGIMSGKAIRFAGQKTVNLIIAVALCISLIAFIGSESKLLFLVMCALAFVLGFLLIIPIGGADMPVIVSMLNSYSGWAAAGIGFTLANPLLIITGALVGASGAILSYIMCKAMNRSLLNVMFGGFGDTATSNNADTPDDRPVRQGSAEDAAFLMENASSVIIVPGYGMAVAQAQHALRELADTLEARGIRVRYAIHPVAGRMPGHMNVLLAEANVSYDDVFELDDINSDFSTTDVVYVIGANDVTNPAAKTDPSSPIYGMPILDVAAAQNILFVKRSMAAGYAGVQNELFYLDKTMMLFGDARDVTEKLTKAIKGGGH
jgi:NAD(P) transhydrogenase subunit beta